MRKCGAYDCEASVWSIHIEQIGRFTHSVNIENINNCIAKLNVFSLKGKDEYKGKISYLKYKANWLISTRKDDFEKPF